MVCCNKIQWLKLTLYSGVSFSHKEQKKRLGRERERGGRKIEKQTMCKGCGAGSKFAIVTVKRNHIYIVKGSWRNFFGSDWILRTMILWFRAQKSRISKSYVAFHFFSLVVNKIRKLVGVSQHNICIQWGGGVKGRGGCWICQNSPLCTTLHIVTDRICNSNENENNKAVLNLCTV